MTPSSNNKSGSSWEIIYFTGPGCQVCKVLEPQVRKMVLKNFPDVVYRMINVADEPEIAARSGVYTVPVILMLYESKEYLREVRFISIRHLADKIARLLELSAR